MNRLSRRRAQLAPLALGLSLGIALTLALSAFAKSTPKAEVRAPQKLCTQTAPSGKARVTPLAQGKNAFVARLELNANAKVPEHRDSTEEYIHVLAGGGTMMIDDVAHPVVPGATIYMPANAKVSFTAGPTALSAIQVFAGPAPAAKYAKWTGCGG